jgi:hypothetical protein
MHPALPQLKLNIMTLKTYDKNFFYSMEIDKSKWRNKDKDQLEDCIVFELNNFDNLTPIPKDIKIPDETGFVMSIEDAKHLKAFLEVALNNL